MALTLGEGLFGVAILFGVVLGCLGVYCYRQWNEPGVTPFAVFAVFLGVGAVSGTVVALVQGGNLPQTGAPLWMDVALTGWVFSMVPWIIFALQYTGRYTRFSWRTVGAISVPVVGIVSLFVSQPVIGSTLLTQLFATLSLLYVFALMAVGSYLLLRTTRRYGHLSVYLGLTLAIAVAGPLVVINSVGSLPEATVDATVYGGYALAFAIPSVGLVLAVFRYDMFESTPAAGALGERAIARETDDLVVVVDRESRVIKMNETTVETLEVSPTNPLGTPLSALLGTTVEQLEETETVELDTTVGKRKFDPQITAFTDQHDRRLGYLLSLRDVTERQLRKQRLEVLNRVLRHNIRNRIDVIKGNAEAVADEADSNHASTILDSADELAMLSSKARSTDKLVSRPTNESEKDLSAVVRELTATDRNLEVTLDIPETAPLCTDWRALRAALESAIENAFEYARESVTITVETLPDGYRIAVADDGPGIPDSELASIDAGSETPLKHGTGLGLWQLTWGVTKLNGELAFDTTDGTTVQMTIPHQSE